MVAQRGTATSATAANGTSVSATKPTGVISGDLLLAVFTCNNQTVTAPSGWTRAFNDSASTGNVWSTGVWYKVAGASEGTSYSFNVPSSAPLVLTLSAWSGVDTAAVNAVAHLASGSLSEPHTGPSATATASVGRVVYVRAVREAGSTVPTFSTAAGGVTEVVDKGVFSGGSVCYANAQYADTADFSSSGSKAGLAISCSQSETDNVEATIIIKSSSTPASGSFSSTLPKVGSTDFEVNTHFDATISATLPHPVTFAGSGLGQPIVATGPIASTLPKVSSSFVAANESFGAIASTVLPLVRISAETRVFGIRVITVDFDDSRTIAVQPRSVED